MNLHHAEFVVSAASPRDFPRDGLPQIAFAGKSNVGKSSVINKLLLRKNLARVGEAPGKTTHINYFRVDDRAYFVDLPGYGYAKVSQKEKDRWADLIGQYFSSEGLITLGIQIVDARHKPTALDVTMADWFMQTGCPFLVVANKLDKLRKSDIPGNLCTIRETLGVGDACPVISFSAEKGQGREELLQHIFAACGENA